MQRLKAQKQLATILIACLSGKALATSPEEGASILLRSPKSGVIEKYFVPKPQGEGWFIENAFRERLVSEKIIQCTSPVSPFRAPMKLPECAPAAPAILQETPPTDSIKKEFFPSGGAGNGWWVTNQYREDQIDLRLHQCDETRKIVLPACTGMALDPQSLSFWQTPAGVLGLVVLGGLAGYYLGGLASPRLRAGPTYRPLP